MKVLVATNHSQGSEDTDFCETIENELVIIPGDCLDEDCVCERGCDPSFLGLASGQRTTTTKIVNRPDLHRSLYAGLVAACLVRLGLIGCHGACEDCRWMLEGHLLDLDFLVGPGQEHDVIRRLGCDYSRASHSAGLG